jgi:multiple sugar transport system substrate-binding protein
MIALPDKSPAFKYNSTNALAYNKDIFDRFAVPYPKDDMTWDEVIELSKRFNRNEGGVEYHGLTMINPWNFLRDQLNIGFLNKNGKVDLSDRKWNDLFNVLKAVDEAQNHWPSAVVGGYNPFEKDKDTAMLVGTVNKYILSAAQYESMLNWDIASFPHFSGQSPALPYTSGFYVPTSKSKHLDAVMDLVAAAYAADKDTQNMENALAKTKHLDALKNRPVVLSTPDKYTTALQTVLQKQVAAMTQNNQDINTALRTTQEAMQKQVDQMSQ